MRHAAPGLAVLLAVAGVPPQAHAAAAAHAAGKADTQIDQLVALLVPDDAMADLAMRTFDYQLARENDAAARALEARYPGLKAQVAGKLRPKMAKLLKRELPRLRKDIGAILAAELTSREIADTRTFFASPAGRKVYAAVLKAMGDKPDRSEADATAAAMQAAISSLAASDYPAMIRFGASGAAAKMGSVNPKIASASRAWAERLIAKHGGKMRKLAKRTADKYAARARKGGA